MKPLQEKFQIMVPGKPEGEEGWASFESARQSQGNVCAENRMPPGMEMANQDDTEQNSMPLSLSGRSDVSAHMASRKALEDGFSKLPMKGCDDQYTGEHVDHFYGDAGGFVERNNYLDRE